MSDQKISRRDFLKMAGVMSAVIPAMPIIKVVGKIDGDDIIASPEQYGGFFVRQRAEDDPPYEIDESIYKRFDQKNEFFARGSWDEEWAATLTFADRAQQMADNVPGYSREDYAFYGAAWTVATSTGTIGGSVGGYQDGLYHPQAVGAFNRPFAQLPPWDWKQAGYSDQDATNMVKVAARFYGASLVGIAPLHDRWLYEQYYDMTYYKPGTLFRGAILREDAEEAYYKDNGDLVIPNSMKWVVVLAFEMDEEGHLYPGGPTAGATGEGYSRMAFSSACLAEFLRGLGYKAVPAGNSLGLSVPMAIDDGLGEDSRMGLLITPKYGPRVRLAKVITNMPLVPDKPIKFGVSEFCEICGKCADSCPGNAIDEGPRTWTGKDISNADGVLKWYNQHGDCLAYWRASGLSCSRCISVCPFNKPDSWLHDATRALIGIGSGVVNKALLNIDDASGYGKLPEAKEGYVDFYTKKDKFTQSK